MDSTGLYEHFRSQTFDTAEPYLWSDAEVFLYADDACKMFARLTGGIQDFTSDITRIAVAVGESSAEYSKKILRITDAFRVSDGANVKVVNFTDRVTSESTRDYGTLIRNVNKPVPGPITHMMIGRQKGLAQWTVIPTVEDEVQTTVYRLPLTTIDGEGQTLEGIDDEHHIHLVTWMKSLAYQKDDVEVQDLNKAADYETKFRTYCEKVKSEIDRMKHKTRTVQYGGI